MPRAGVHPRRRRHHWLACSATRLSLAQQCQTVMKAAKAMAAVNGEAMIGQGQQDEVIRSIVVAPRGMKVQGDASIGLTRQLC